MLPYGKEKKLRKELFEAPKQQLDEAKQKMCLLLQHLEQMKQQQGIQAADAGAMIPRVVCCDRVPMLVHLSLMGSYWL